MRHLPTIAAALNLLAVATGGGRAAAQATGEYPLEISVREIWTTSGDPGFGTIGGMAQWPDGTVWIGDRRLAEVSEVSSDGANVRVVLRKGEGPGEVARVLRIDMLPGGGAVVMTLDNYEIFRANRSFDRRQRKLEGIWAWGFAATPEAGFLVSGGYGYVKDDELAKYAVHRYDRRGRHLGSWHPAVDHGRETVRNVLASSAAGSARTREASL